MDTAVHPAPAARPVPYERRRPEETTLYQLVQERLETFLAQVELETGAGLPEFVQEELDAFLECGVLAHGFLRLRCADCTHEKLVAFCCTRRGFCPSGGARPWRRPRPTWSITLSPSAGAAVGALVSDPASLVIRYTSRVARARLADRDHAEVPTPAAPAPMSWARLLKRVFEIDIEQCPRCGGTLKIIAAIEYPPVIAKILTHLGLPARAPPRSPARSFDRF